MLMHMRHTYRRWLSSIGGGSGHQSQVFNLWHPIVLALVLIGLGLFARATHAAQVVATPFGSPSFIANPTWTVTDFRTFTAPIGTPASGFVEFGQTIQSVFPAPNHAAHPT